MLYLKAMQLQLSAREVFRKGPRDRRYGPQQQQHMHLSHKLLTIMPMVNNFYRLLQSIKSVFRANNYLTCM